MTLRYLVDTDWAIHYLDGNQDIVATLQQIKTEGLALSVVSLAELFEGVYYSKTPDEDERDLNDFLKGVNILGIDEETCKVFGKERGRLRSKKKKIGDFDLMIGSTALQHKLKVLTNNRKHFELIEGVEIGLRSNE